MFHFVLQQPLEQVPRLRVDFVLKQSAQKIVHTFCSEAEFFRRILPPKMCAKTGNFFSGKVLKNISLEFSQISAKNG
jgi:hypothetical protein